MRTFALLYNLSCGASAKAVRRLNRLRRAFHARGVKLRPYGTSSPASSPAVVQAALAGGCEAILAAGGDGTFNDLLQATMQADKRLPIGIVPFGSGNVLAQELELSRDAARLAAQLIGARRTKIPVGLLSGPGNRGATVMRYFSVAAGIGADARVICGVNPAWKKKMGIGAYYVEAARQLLFSRQDLPLFRVQFTDSQTGRQRDDAVSQLIVERVAYFSSPLTGPSAAVPLLSEMFRLVLFKTQDPATYLRYGLQLLARKFHLPATSISGIEIVHAKAVSCAALPEYPAVLTEVDGELVGGLPAEIVLIPQALHMLLPRQWANRPGHSSLTGNLHARHVRATHVT